MLTRFFTGGVALAVLGAAVAYAQQPAKTPDLRRLEELRSPSRMALIAEPVPESEYWLGIHCFPVTPAIKAQLNLPEKQGLLVLDVVPESPAAKAGVAQHDVLIRLGERALGEPRDLVEAVNAAKNAKLKMELVRGGKRQTVEITPAKRPEEARRMRIEPLPSPSQDDWQMIEKWLRGMQPGNDGQMGPPLRIPFFGPGAIVPKDVLVQKPMPANLSIVVSKQGEQPARIVVKRDRDEWKLTETELDKLPADLRPFVERMLGRGVIFFGGLKASDRVPGVMVPAVPQPPGQMQTAPFPSFEQRLERRLDEMERRMDRLFKMMEELSAGHDRPRDNPPQENH